MDQSNTNNTTTASESTDEDVELRELILKELDSRGVLPAMKAQLRAEVFRVLNNSEAVPNATKTTTMGPTIATPEGAAPESAGAADGVGSVAGRVRRFNETRAGELCSCLVLDLLDTLGLRYTRAVLVAEAGDFGGTAAKDDACAPLTRAEVTRALRLPPSDATRPLLEDLVELAAGVTDPAREDANDVASVSERLPRRLNTSETESETSERNGTLGGALTLDLTGASTAGVGLRSTGWGAKLGHSVASYDDKTRDDLARPGEGVPAGRPRELQPIGGSVQIPSTVSKSFEFDAQSSGSNSLAASEANGFVASKVPSLDPRRRRAAKDDIDRAIDDILTTSSEVTEDRTVSSDGGAGDGGAGTIDDLFDYRERVAQVLRS